MSDKDEHKHEDADLAAYLDGSDGVSDAYRSLALAEPPAQLDARILAAARGDKTLGERKSARDFAVARLRGRLSLAASLVLGVIIGLQLPADLRLQQESARSVGKVASQDAGSSAFVDAPREDADLVAVTESVAVAEEVANAASSSPASTRSSQGRSAGLSAADEVVVTGARLQRAEPPAAAPVAFAAEPDYRQSIVLWLREIAHLQEQLGDSDSAVLQQQVDEERALFQQRYPGIGLEIELENLRNTTPGN